MYKNILVIMFGVMFVLSASASAMTFSQPVKIGQVWYANLGGFRFSQEVYNDIGVIR